MADEFTVKILSPEDFNKLPFKRIQENPDSVFGAAEMATKTAYVKDTGFNDFTKANIGHELDELMAATSPHEEDGIRYKSFGQSFGNFLGSTPAIGGLLKPLGSFVGGGIDLLGAGAGKLGIPNFNIGSPGAGQQFTVPGPQGGSITGTPQGPTPTALGRTSPVAGPGGRLITGAEQAPTPRATGGGGGIGSFFSKLFGGGGGGAPTAGGVDFTTGIAAGTEGKIPGAADTGGNFISSIFKGLKENPEIAGSLISTIGDLFGGGGGGIDVSGITEEARSRAEGRSPTALFGEAEKQLIADLRDPTTAPPASAFERGDQVIEEDLADQIKTLRQQFAAATGSTDVSNNSAFLREKSRLEERARERRAAVRDEISFQFTREQLQRDLQEIELALNLDTAQTTQLIQLAQLDAEALAFNEGLELREAQEFKELFGNFGDLLTRTPEEQATEVG